MLWQSFEGKNGPCFVSLAGLSAGPRALQVWRDKSIVALEKHRAKEKSKQLNEGRQTSSWLWIMRKKDGKQKCYQPSAIKSSNREKQTVKWFLKVCFCCFLCGRGEEVPSTETTRTKEFAYLASQRLVLLDSGRLLFR